MNEENQKMWQDIALGKDKRFQGATMQERLSQYQRYMKTESGKGPTPGKQGGRDYWDKMTSEFNSYIEGEYLKASQGLSPEQLMKKYGTADKYGVLEAHFTGGGKEASPQKPAGTTPPALSDPTQAYHRVLARSKMQQGLLGGLS